MSRIKALRVKNLRALEDSNYIELKPITLLVGRNSVGKSTFSRVFPLLRQSNEEKRRAPVLWYGKYVDFGSFAAAVSRQATTEEISLCFDISMEPEDDPFFVDDWWPTQEYTLARETQFVLEIVLGCTEKGNTYVKRTHLSTCDMTCVVYSTQDEKIEKVECGDFSWIPSTDTVGQAIAGEFLPQIKFFKVIRPKDKSVTRLRPDSPFWSELVFAIKKFAHPNIKPETISKIAHSLPIGTANDVLDHLRRANNSATWRKSTEKITTESAALTAIRQLTLINKLGQIFQALDFSISNFSRGVRYLEPLRATAQRYYRVQELAVDEIDSKGGNLAVFIHSMNALDRDRFNDWLKTHLGFEVHPVPDGGHITLRVRFANEAYDTNLADTGFGMSQVLPIATQLWSSRALKTRQTSDIATTCFVVEQPELHLHPAFQEQIADLFVASVEISATSKRRPIQIVAETHSSSLINRLGELISTKRIDRNDVQVVMFDQISLDAPVKTQVSQFDADGVLQNWPLGFFAAGRSE